MKPSSHGWRIAAAGIAAPLLLWPSGCATASQPAAMVAAPVEVQNRSAAAVMVAVSGGSETTATTGPNISNEDFATAVRRSISDSKLFASVTNSLPADYRIDVLIVRVQQPLFGASFKVTLECTWRLSDQRNNSVVWEKAVTSSYTANMGDAFVGVTRLRLATEGAARANISDAIAMLGRLSLK